ncbi:MAG: hypothetical protein AB1Z98_14155 [Nannocystaceae bacterium]
MKLRILDDSLRLRLPQSDVARLRADDRVEAAIHFGPGPRQRLVYALVVSPTAQRMSAVITEGEIAVHLPAQVARDWMDGDEVSLRGEQSVGEGRTLSLLIEKDFKCVVPREGEDAYDGFANPNASC